VAVANDASTAAANVVLIVKVAVADLAPLSPTIGKEPLLCLAGIVPVQTAVPALDVVSVQRSVPPEPLVRFQ
jgi:hypothetical protein